MTLNEIWTVPDKGDLLLILSEYIGKKCDCGDRLDVLSQPERMFYIALETELEVDNGGFSQFFCNSTGAFANEIVSAFTAIGALNTVPICEKALAIIGVEIPTDPDAREAMMDEVLSDEAEARLDECDRAFYAYEDDLDELYYAYVMRHKEAFT